MNLRWWYLHERFSFPATDSQVRLCRPIRAKRGILDSLLNDRSRLVNEVHWWIGMGKFWIWFRDKFNSCSAGNWTASKWIKDRIWFEARFKRSNRMKFEFSHVDETLSIKFSERSSSLRMSATESKVCPAIVLMKFDCSSKRCIRSDRSCVEFNERRWREEKSTVSQTVVDPQLE